MPVEAQASARTTGQGHERAGFGPEVVGLVNGFITKKCAEIKAELSAGKAN